MKSKSIPCERRTAVHILELVAPAWAQNKNYLVKIPGAVKILDIVFTGKTGASQAIAFSILKDNNATDIPLIAAAAPYSAVEFTAIGTPVAIGSITTPSNAYGRVAFVPVVGQDTITNRVLYDETYSVLYIAVPNSTAPVAGAAIQIYYSEY
ncbi:MAG TPA: hypothetical protein PL124_10695 [Candidatus Cloacimonadota bacterium]|nr:hypothetical protein [Candidatus Cloacimonadota bacterium]